MGAAVRPEWMDRPETWVGMAVDLLLCADDARHGGTIVALEPLAIDGDLLCAGVPVIRLDDGRTVRGYECWWTPTEVPG